MKWIQGKWKQDGEEKASGSVVLINPQYITTVDLTRKLLLAEDCDMSTGRSSRVIIDQEDKIFKSVNDSRLLTFVKRYKGDPVSARAYFEQFDVITADDYIKVSEPTVEDTISILLLTELLVDE